MKKNTLDYSLFVCKRYKEDPKNATVWNVIKGFQKEESIARVMIAEYLRDIHQSHNSFRNKTQLERMRQLYILK